MAFSDNKTVRRLNKQFRGVDRATDVLSFPQYSKAALRKLRRQFAATAHLGAHLSGPHPLAPPASRHATAPLARTRRTTKKLTTPFTPSPAAPIFLGDIILAHQYVTRAARQKNRPLDFHIAHLIVHAILHLYGHEHDTDAGHVRMVRLERLILRRLGYPDPYDDT